MKEIWIDDQHLAELYKHGSVVCKLRTEIQSIGETLLVEADLEKITGNMTNEMREILLNALAQAWIEKKIETVDEYMDAVRQVKEMK